jgi:heat-inducible transcriptional repressor
VRVFVDSVDKLFEVEVSSDRLHLAGGHNLLEYPEFEERRLVKGVIELIENDEMIIHILDRMEESSDVKVLIGSEINNELLNDYSLVVTNYFIGPAKGSIGLIGPKRMNYSKMFSLVQYVSSLINGTGK